MAGAKDRAANLGGYAQPRAPLYVMDCGIEVISVYPARGRNVYWRLRVRPHPFFAGQTISGQTVSVRRSRAVLSAKLGRALTRGEHVHHIDGNRENDAPDNLALVTADEHNKHHKIGARHSAESRAKTSASLKRAYADGRHKKPTSKRRDQGNGELSCD